jgi:hypothetical protein
MPLHIVPKVTVPWEVVNNIMAIRYEETGYDSLPSARFRLVVYPVHSAIGHHISLTEFQERLLLWMLF